MLKDQRGFLWLGTQSGLNRFDGYRFQQFHYEPNKSGALNDGFIWALYEDRDGHIWIGTSNGGLNRYDPSRASFESFVVDPNNPHSISSNTVVDIVEDKYGYLWLATAKGLNRLDKNTLHFKSYQHDPNDETTISSNNLTKLMFDHQGVLWIGTGSARLRPAQKGGLNRFDPKTETFVRFIHDPDSSQSISNDNIVSLAQDNERNIWVGTFSGELNLIEPNSLQVERDPIGKLPQSSGVNSLFIDKDNRLWAAVTDVGLLEADLVNRSYYVHQHDRGNPHSLSENEIHVLLGEDSGVFWVGTWSSGVSKFSLLNRRFSTYGGSQVSSLGVTGESILSIAVSSDEMWLAAWEKGLQRVDLRRRKTFVYTHSPTDTRSVSDYIVRLVFMDSKNNLWIGTRNGGLNRYDRETDDFSRYLHDPEDDTSISHNHVTAMVEDLSGNLWIGTRGGGLNHFDPETGVFTHYLPLEGEDKSSISSDSISGLFVDRENNLWIATKEGLNRLSAEDQQFYWYQASDEPDSLSSNSVTTIYQDEQDTIWVGTQNGGLNKAIWYGENLKFEHIMIADGMASNSVGIILGDRDNNLWLSTTHGITRFDPTSKKLKNFYHKDGTVRGGYYVNSGTVGKDGKLYFGGIEGGTVIQPREFSGSNAIPELAITDFLLFNKSVAPQTRDPDSPLEYPILATSRIELDYTQSVFGFELAVLDFRDPVANQYAYKLEGFDEQWITTSADKRFATYTNIPPGSYTFRFRGSNNEGVWNEEGVSIRIKINPAPWFSWWAFLLYVSAAFGIILTFSFQRLAQLRQSREAQQEIAESEQRLKLALWGSGEELWDWNMIAGKVYRTNRLSKVRLPDTISTSVQNGGESPIHPKDFPRTQDAIKNYLDGKTEHYEVAYRVKDVNGEWRWVLDRGRIVERNDIGKPTRMTGMLKDINDVKSTEEQLRLIATAFENTSDAIWIADKEYHIEFVNKSFYTITGFEAKEVIGRRLRLLSSNDEPEEMEERIRAELIQFGQWQGEILERRKNGELYPAELSIDCIRDEDGLVTHYVGVFSDITFRKRSEDELRRMANYDTLTKLPNRSLFYDRVNHAIERMSRKNNGLALFFMDIDQFKKINDSLGHQIGDQLLCGVGERLTHFLKSEDTVSRFGGDEFCILIEQVDSSATAAKISKRLIDAFQKPFSIEGFSMVVTPSIGVVLYPADGTEVETLIKNADTAMYQAKNKGRNTFEFFADEMNRNAKLRLELESEIRTALNSDEFEVYYQPKVNILSGDIVSMEALVRWNSPKRGMVSPGQFIPIAEESGLIIELGKIVLKKACHDVAEWIERGLFDKRVAVNLSVIQFRQHGHIIETVQQTLEESKITADHLELEITEGMVMEDVDNAIHLMHQLSNLKVHISIDDFGTGYSSLYYLKKFPVNTLKIDRVFILDLEHNQQDARIVSSIINLAHSMGLKVVAEGVETIEQLKILRFHGCDEIQGYLFSRPLSKEQFEDMLVNNTQLEDVI
nr:EAL domain-containing protein [Pleionea sp. CnH1-48]